MSSVIVTNETIIISWICKCSSKIGKISLIVFNEVMVINVVINPVNVVFIVVNVALIAVNSVLMVIDWL